MFELDKLDVERATKIFNSGLPDEEFERRLKENRAAMRTLRIKLDALLLPLYRKLRRMGFKHYPDLVV